MLRTAPPVSPRVHASALVDESVELHEGVVIGPHCVIGPGVTIGAGTELGPKVVIERNTRIGAACRVHSGAVLGGDPQDLKYDDQDESWLVVGDRTVIREFVTLNRGTAARGSTVIGNDCLLMAYAHVAHDCVLGDHAIIANAVNMGGHVQIGDAAIIGGLTALHQFVQVGAHTIVSGASAVRKDVPPFMKAAGNPLRLFGLNTVGLQRRGFEPAVRTELRRAYRLLFQSRLNVSAAVARARLELEPLPEVVLLLDFIERSRRGIVIGEG